MAATIPSPSNGVWHLGSVPIRGYALCIILGIIAAIWIGERRWVARGGRPGDVQDIAIWAVPFGIVGARLYHVATDWQRYFGDGQNPVTALYVWRGGLGIWGGVALGAVGAYVGCRAKGIKFLPMADTLAPGVLIAQALGRWGNWFNQELYGRPTDLPWGLEIDRDHWPTECDYPKGSGTCTFEVGTTFHPTFLYECLWNIGAFALVIYLERRFKLGFGRVMAVYVMAYTLGRGWIEYLRIDDVQLENVLGLRFNVWTSIILFTAAAIYFVVSSKRHPGREESVFRDGAVAVPADGAVADATDEPDADGTSDVTSETAEVPEASGDLSTED
ncbi:prolipoprotein diacylglyceryl transferase [Nocardioides humilatus]|uniref:Phosphatidylglycerol--prolipoprotein diacylglyceryl transferase n=1 Tax=Nocardioides humilatus TaxID=2607660 RepID=A0A5B1LCK4_9ACTN|nr:prolipoprotein diacylglyceryl transferase [Nocardioides humilatus]